MNFFRIKLLYPPSLSLAGHFRCITPTRKTMQFNFFLSLQRHLFNKSLPISSMMEFVNFHQHNFIIKSYVQLTW